MIIATSAAVDKNWTGDPPGLAIYDSALTQEQILRHYKTWTARGRPQIVENDRAVALYLFDEGQGRIVHNRLGSGVDLYIPERFMLLHEKILEPFWKEFSWDWSYWKAVIVNVAGLVPLGFFFCAYFVSVRGMKRAVLATVALGLAVSLTIETLQGFLPTRDSGTTDLITNTLGTYLGTALYLRTRARDWLSRVLDRVACATRG